MTDIRKGKRVKNSRSTVQRNTYKLDKLFEQFKEVKKAEGIAYSTISQYDENFAYFVDYLDCADIPHDIRKINEDVLRSYVVYMREEIARY
ncbi:hypothetical protein [Siminovitchia terrae]|uniref:hypothetical protein n=1 Tax=Siminovitchia terrae TaxID=1914933 RepID=UPI001FE6C7EF|nr:hypothetical protein [Siminovitchia terrae]